MTNWVVVIIGFGIIGLAFLLYRNAEGFAALQQRQAQALKQSEAQRSRLTPGLARLGAIGFAVMGVVWIVMGAFFGDKM